ncbi:MAG: metal-binding protein [Chloroflexaceae bacterium]|nr:metal-binding protein [Chloroflexaceae bacterium]
MPSGSTHDRLIWLFLPLVAVLSLTASRSWQLSAIAIGAYLFSGFMFGPDLDIYSVQFKRWGPLRFLWWPYQKRLRHRSWLSHGFLVGTALRCLYLLSIVAIMLIFGAVLAQTLWGLSWSGSWLTRPASRIPVAALGWGFLGLELGAMNHAIADWATSRCRRRSHGKPRRRK